MILPADTAIHFSVYGVPVVLRFRPRFPVRFSAERNRSCSLVDWMIRPQPILILLMNIKREEVPVTRSAGPKLLVLEGGPVREKLLVQFEKLDGPDLRPLVLARPFNPAA